METSLTQASPKSGTNNLLKSSTLKHPWRFVALFSIIQFCIYGFGSAYELMVPNGVCFHYVFAYFISLMVVVPVLATGRFGAGTAVYIPFATLGFFIEYYMEWVVNPNLIAPWAAAFWSIFGLLTGFSADLAYRFLPTHLKSVKRAVMVGMIVGIADFCLTLAVLTFPYKDPVSGVAHLLYGWPIMLPYLLLSAAFAGYTAHAIANHVNTRPLSTKNEDNISKKPPRSIIATQ